jgi:predicted nucleotidyltransferase
MVTSVLGRVCKDFEAKRVVWRSPSGRLDDLDIVAEPDTWDQFRQLVRIFEPAARLPA